MENREISYKLHRRKAPRRSTVAQTFRFTSLINSSRCKMSRRSLIINLRRLMWKVFCDAVEYILTIINAPFRFHHSPGWAERVDFSRLLHAPKPSVGASTALSAAISKNDLAATEKFLNYFRKFNDYGKPDLNDLLFEAIRSSNVDMAALLLRDTTEVNFRDRHHGESPLHCAAKYLHHKIVKMLVDRGADVNMLDRNGKTALYAAISSAHLNDPGGYWSCLRTIWQILGSRPDVRNEVNSLTLYKAITRDVEECSPKTGRITIINNLVFYGLTVRPEDARDSVFVYQAIRYEQAPIIEAILNHGIDVNEMYEMRNGGTQRMTLLHMAVVWNQYKIAEFLVNEGADVYLRNSNGSSAVRDAIERRHQRIAEIMLSSISSAEIAKEYFRFAVTNMCDSVVTMMVKTCPHIDVNWADENGVTALHLATVSMVRRPNVLCVINEHEVEDEDLFKQARLAIVETLLSAGASANSKTTDKGVTALHYAVSNGHYTIVKKLLEYGADANCRDNQGLTPIFEAARNGSRSIVNSLLKFLADTNSKLPDGKAVIHAACESGTVEVVRTLCRVGCDLNARDGKGATALHYATVYGDRTIVVTLLEYGANVNAKNVFGRTALHIAAFYSWSAITKVLLENGADTHARCNDSKLPIAYATYDDLSHQHANGKLPEDRQPDIELDETIYKVRCGSSEHFCHLSCREEIFKYIEKYQVEAEMMMTVLIRDSGVTFHDLLIGNMEKLIFYVRNECIVKVIESKIYDSEFPLYREMVQRRFKEAQERNRMWMPALTSLDLLTGYKFPPEMEEIFLQYLSSRDMKNLIDSGSPPN